MEITDEQWGKARIYFDSIYNGYKARLGVPGICVDYTTEYVLKPLLKRFEDGERSEELFNAMQNVE